MVALVVVIIMVIVAIIGGVTLAKARTEDGKVVGGILATIGSLVAVLVFVLGSITSVPTRTVGIVTEFGKAVGTVDSGFHWLSLWSEVTEFPTSNQTLDLDASDGSGKVVEVKFEGGGTGYANVNIVWQAQDNKSAVTLYNNWKEFNLVGEKVVEPQTHTIVSQVVGKYAPEDAIKSENNKKISDDILSALNTLFNSQGIKIESVAVKKIDVDRVIQERINRKFVADQNIEIARKDQDRAVIEEATNKAKEKSLTDGALRAECLEITKLWDDDKSGPLPANWSCGVSSLPLTIGAK